MVLGDMKSRKKFPMLSDMLNFKGNDKSTELKSNNNKINGLSWQDLVQHGTVRETIEHTDDGLTLIARNFWAEDKSLNRFETTTLKTEFYNQYKKLVNIDDVKGMIEELQGDLEHEKIQQNFELCATYRDQIDFLKKEFNIK